MIGAPCALVCTERLQASLDSRSASRSSESATLSECVTSLPCIDTVQNTPTPVARIKALVIEDDASLVDLVRDVLTTIGCDDVHFVATGGEALRIALAVAPD